MKVREIILSIPFIWDFLLNLEVDEIIENDIFDLSIPFIWDFLLNPFSIIENNIRIIEILSIPFIWDFLLNRGESHLPLD